MDTQPRIVRSPTERIRLLVVDHQLVADALRLILQHQFTIAGTIHRAPAAPRAAAELQPDIVLMELSLPGSMEAAMTIQEADKRIQVVFLTSETGAPVLSAIQRMPAAGFVRKQQSSFELCMVLRKVAGGRSYIAPELLNCLSSAREVRPSLSIRPRNITTRQTEVLQLVATGKTVKEIGTVLGISAKTAEYHKGKLMDSLGLRTTAELTRFAIENSLLQAS